MDQRKLDVTFRLWDGLLEYLGQFKGVAHLVSYHERSADWTYWHATIETAADLKELQEAFATSIDVGVRAKLDLHGNDEAIAYGTGRVVFIKELDESTGGLIGVAGLKELVEGRDAIAAMNLVFDLFDKANRFRALS